MDAFENVFLVAFRSYTSSKGHGAEYTLRSKCRGCGQCLECDLYSEALDRLVAARERFDRSKSALIKLLEKSQDYPLYIHPFSMPFPNPFVRSRWSHFIFNPLFGSRW